MQEVAHRKESVELPAARWSASTGIPRPLSDKSIPLSPAQEQIWLHAQLAPHTPIYNEAVTIRRNGTLDVPALERSFTEIVRRHQAWRTAFTFVEGELVEVIHPAAPVHFPVFDLSNVPFPQREAEALRLAAKAAGCPFDLSRHTLFRGFVAHLSETEHRLFLTLHHIIFDGYSISRVLLPELATLYSAFSTHQTANLPDPPIQYSDFAMCERDWLSRDCRKSSQLEYWRKQLAGDPQILQLPIDRTRPPIPSFRGATEPITLDRKLSDSLKHLSRNEMSSLFMTMLAAFAVLLQRYSSSSALTIGTVSSRRKRVELEQLLGCFINPVALRIDLAGDPTFLEVLRRTRNVTLQALSNDDVPFAQVVNEVHANHTLSSHPLFQVLFTLESPLLNVPEGWDVSLTQPEVHTGMSRFDLSLELDDRPGGICGQFRYSTDLFDRETVLRMKGHFATLLDSITANPYRRISRLNLLTPTEEQTFEVNWNNPSTDQHSDQSLHQLFERQAKRTPEAVALMVGSACLTYDELDRKTDQLAADLRQRGIRLEQRVGLYLEPSIEMIVGTIGVLKAGGACVPLDPSYPAERLSYAITDTQISVLLTQQHLRPQLPTAELEVLCLDDENRIEQPSPNRFPSDCMPDNLAYVIYTSGSTGKPKGVQITHGNLLHSTRARSCYYGPGPTRFLLLSSFSFDSSLAGILGTLCHGGTLVLIPGPLKSNLTRLSHLIQKHEITRLLCVPTLYSLILEQAKPGELSTLREAIVGGESCSAELVERHYELVPQAVLFNEYGPTEAAVWSTVHKCSPEIHGNLVPIGKPIPNTRVYVLDPNLNLMPIGVAGELCISGPGVVRGYLNRPEETEKSFVPDPFRDITGTRLYKTGDVARYLRDGNLELLGRLDHQVKIRGFRIELEEVEAAICECDGVRHAAVTVRHLGGMDPELVAYVVPKGGCELELEALRRFLSRKLPDAMVPSRFATLESLPLMPNGKVNRHALSSIVVNVRVVEIVLPEDALEHKLVEIWKAVLKKTEIGVTASFFDLGGNSLLVAKLLLRVDRDFGKRLSLSDIFQSPTIRQLARLLVEGRQRPVHPAVIALQPQGSRTPLFCVDAGSLWLPLSSRLDGDRPVLGLRVPVSEAGRFKVPFRIEDGAAELVHYLREIQASGPYYLAGLCIDGLVAYEMARQLVSQGQEVAVLALLDIPSPSRQQVPLAESGARIPPTKTKIEMLWTELLQGGISGAPGFVHRRCKAIARRLKLFRWSVQQSLGLKLNVNKLLNDPDVVEEPTSYFSKPRPYSGRVLFFQSDDCQSLDPAWYNLISGGWKVHRVGGGHLSMFYEENVGSLADELRASLSE